MIQNDALPIIDIVKIAQFEITQSNESKDDKKEINEFVTSHLLQTFGKHKEKAQVEELQLRDSNSKFYCKMLFVLENGIQFKLGGRIDGSTKDSDELVEIKNRKTHLFIPPPQYDIIQLHCYMWLHDRKCATLMQYAPKNYSHKTIVPWDADLWNTIVADLKKFAKLCCNVIQNPVQQQILLTCLNPVQKQKWYETNMK